MVTIRFAARASPLSRSQAESVAAALRRHDPSLAITFHWVRTSGDRWAERSLASFPTPGVFVDAVHAAVLAGHADVGVHSLKDLPTTLPPSLTIAAIPPRADPRDALLLPACRPQGYERLDDLPSGLRVGTSALRRHALLRRYRPDWAAVEMRGNVDTRCRKLDDGQVDALILARAGLERLGLRHRIALTLPLETWLPAPGQGALALVAPTDRPDLIARLAALHDPVTAAAVAAERACLHALEAGCRQPVGAWAEARGGRLRLRAGVAPPSLEPWIEHAAEGPVDEPDALGRAVATTLRHALARASA